MYYDPDTNRPYDATLTKVDVRWGLYGLNLTYKLQVAIQKILKNTLYLCFLKNPFLEATAYRTSFNGKETLY